MAACLSILGSAIALLPKLLAMALLFQPQPLFFFIGHGTQVGAVCPWLASCLLLAFSLTFFFKYEYRRNKLLKLAFAAGAVGWFIMAAAQSLVIINYLTTGRLLWLTDLFASGPIIFVSSSSLAFLTLGFFYLTFARQQSFSFSD